MTDMDIESLKKEIKKYENDMKTFLPIEEKVNKLRRSGLNLDEHIDENENYKVKYEIDERVKDALDDIITDREITIHICDGSQFFKPQGATYIGREWISKDGNDIIPTGKISVNIKCFFEDLEKQGIIKYNRYNKSKDWKTIIDLLGQNYPFILGTEKGKNIEQLDSKFNIFIEKNFSRTI